MKLLKTNYTLSILILILLSSSLLAACIGAYQLTWSELGAALVSGFDWLAEEGSQTTFLLWSIRLPRVFLGLGIGAGLAISGAVLQLIFRNPLADPGLIGVSSGAMLGAATFIVLKTYLPFQLTPWQEHLALPLAAFWGGLGATWVVYQLATRTGQTSISLLLLAGIALTALAGGLTGLLLFYASESELRAITFWNLGALSGATWGMVATVFSVVGVGMVLLFRQAKSLEIMQLGEQEASYLGVEVQQLKQRVLVLTVLVVGTCVAFSGMIGFVGLMVPHLVRLTFGQLSLKELLLYAALVGAILLTWADTLARVIVAPTELPIGILTALMGAPFFLWLLRNQLKNWG